MSLRFVRAGVGGVGAGATHGGFAWRRPPRAVGSALALCLVVGLLVTAAGGALGGQNADLPAKKKGGGGGGDPSPGPGPTTFSGRAMGVFVSTPFATLRFADTGELPPEGGVIDATFVRVDHELVQAAVFLSITMGFDSIAQSEAAVADVTLLPGSSTEISADFVRARSRATCTEVEGTSEIVNLRLAGEQIAVSGEPNQEVTIPGVLTLIINEQRDTSSGGTNEITLNALHLILLAVPGEVIVSSARSDISCGGEQPEPTVKDFVTGGGFILVPGGKANFGFNAGFKPGKKAVSGNFNYVDHPAGMHVKSTSIDEYGGSGTTRTFSGDATINGQPGFTFSVTVSDNGEPGKGSDTFSIELSNGYRRSGVLAGGNIQLHA